MGHTLVTTPPRTPYTKPKCEHTFPSRQGGAVAVPEAGLVMESEDFGKIGAELRTANLPTIFVQEGSYDLDKVRYPLSACRLIRPTVGP